MTAHSKQFETWTATSDDLDLVHAAQDGHVDAFEVLVGRYDRKLLRIAQSVTHNREDAQDAVQEAFFNAYQHLADFREASQFSTWLIRITVNQSVMKLRRRGKATELSLDENFEADGNMLPIEVADLAPNPEQLYWSSELRATLTKALEELCPISRTVFVLRDIEGFSTDQTASALDLSISAVKARLWRTRLQLRERLNHYFAGPPVTGQAKPKPQWDDMSTVAFF